MNVINKPLTSGFSSGWTRKPWAVVHHYTACFTANQTYDILKKRNLSVHFCIERDGTLYRYLEDKDRGWHAGTSQWSGFSGLNNHSFGIEIVNFGWATGESVSKSPYGIYRWKSTTDPEVLPSGKEFYRDEKSGNTKVRVVTKQECAKYIDHRKEWAGKLWAIYPPEQIKAIAWQTFEWMKDHQIIPENIIGHEHINPVGKFDPGPAYPWRKIDQLILDMSKANAPELLDPKFNTKARVKSVQSHCDRMGIPVGDIDGWWGPKTEEAVKSAILKFGNIYHFSDLDIDPNNTVAICSALKLVPGFDARR